MAMENSAASPNDVIKETSSPSKEDLTILDAAKDQHDTAQDRKGEETLSGEKPKNAADPEGVFEDAESPTDGANLAPQGVADSRKAAEDSADEDVMEDENGSVESYDSALERIAVASTGDPASPEGPSSPVFQPVEAPQQIALRQLNLWNTGISSLDSTVLEHVSPTEFRTRVAQIAQSQGLTADSEDVDQVFCALLPLVEAKETRDDHDEAGVETKSSDDVNVGDEGKASGCNVDESRQEVSSNNTESNVDDGGENVEESTKEIPHAESNGDAADEPPVIMDKQPEGCLQSKDVENINVKKEDLTTLQDSASQDSLLENSSKENLAKLDKEGVKDGTGDGTPGTQISKPEPEPEVIEWDDLNESDVDDLGSNNVENRYAEDREPKETLDLDIVDVAGPQQESETAKVEGVDLSPRNEENGGGNEALHVGGQKEGMIVLGSSAKAHLQSDDQSVGITEVSGDATMDSTGAVHDKEATGDDAGAGSKADEMPPDVVIEREEDAEVAPEKLSIDDGKAEASKPVPMGSGESDDLDGLEGVILEGPAIGATEVNEGPQAGEESTSKTTGNETLERELAQEQNDLLKEEVSPRFEETTDAAVKAGESDTAQAMAAEVGSAGGESKQSPIDVSQGEDSEKEIPADSKGATVSANESASSLGGAGPSLPVRPAGLGRSVPSLEHAPRAVQRSGGVPASTRQASVSNDENQSSTDVSEGNEDAREKLQMIRVKFLRLAHRLGQTAHNVVVAQVLYRLGLAEQLRGGRGSGRAGAFSFERASVLAEEQEAAGADDLEFGCTIMVLGKSGVGKSATINSLFDELKSGTNAYSPATNKVQEIVGTVHGIKLRVIDTPGLLTSFADQRRNERIMASVKRFIKKSPPDIVLYFDRLDMQSRDYGDLPLLRTITDTFGSAVWFNAIVVLTHASSAPPDGANGVPVSYEMFVAQRSHVVQQTIRQAAGDMRLMNPVSLVENHAACRRNRAGERVLPNGQVWKPQLLLLCFASKILAEANSLLKLQDNSPTKPFGVRSRVPPLPFLLSSLLQSRAQLKLPDEQVGTDDDESEDESDEEGESEGEEEYDDLPPFRRLTRDELKLLDKEQRRTYAEELEYREKLFMKKQLKDERARKKELKRRLAALPKEVAQYAEENLEDENAAASVPVPMPDMALPPSFDSDNPTYRYRYLDATNQWLVRPVLETHGWDHDSGYDGLNVEKLFVVSKKIPVSVSGQVTKDKKEANLQMECAASVKHGEGKVIQGGLDIQTIGKDLAYTLRGDLRFDNFKRNKTTGGLAVTLLGDTVAGGMKIEDRLLIGKRVKLVFNGGFLTGRGDTAYGGSLEATIRDKDYPIGQFLSTFGLSVMDWHGDLAIGGNLQVQCKLGKAMTIVRGNLNNRRAGQVSIRVSSSEQLQMALIGLIPLLRTFINNRILSSN